MSTIQQGQLIRGAIATAAPPTFSEGEIVNFTCDLNGNLRISGGGGGGGGESSTDESVFSAGISSITTAAGVFNDGLSVLSSGQRAAARITAYRALHGNLRNSSGSEIGVLAAPIRVDPTGTTPQPVELLDGQGNPISSTAGALNVAGSLTVAPPTSSTVSAAGPTTIGTGSVQVLATNANRKRFTLQNAGTTKFFVLYGTGTAGPANFHRVLPACGTPADGSSPPIEDTLWTGPIQVASSAAGGSLSVSEFTA